MIQEVINQALHVETIIDKLKDFYKRNDYRWDEENIIGIRGTDDYYTNHFQCRLALVSDSQILVLNATTIPGALWNPATRKQMGVREEILCLGYYRDAYKVGNHMGHPPGFALVQAAPLRAFRDDNRNSKQDEPIFTVSVTAGDNIHTQKPGDTDDNVNFASAGCQVAKDRDKFLKEFMPRIHQTQKFVDQHVDARWDYHLTDFHQFPFWEEFKAITTGL